MSVQTTLIPSLPGLVKASVLPPNPPKDCSASLAWIPCYQSLLHLSIFFFQLLNGLWFLQSAWHRALLWSQVWKALGWLPELPDGCVSQACLPSNLTLRLPLQPHRPLQFFLQMPSLCRAFAYSLPSGRKTFSCLYWTPKILQVLAWISFPWPGIFYACVRVLRRFSCARLCDPMDYSLPGFCVHGILQARLLEWVAVPSPGCLPDSGIEPLSLMSPEWAGRFFTSSTTWEALYACTFPLWHFSELAMWGYLFILFFGCTVWLAGS